MQFPAAPCRRAARQLAVSCTLGLVLHINKRNVFSVILTEWVNIFLSITCVTPDAALIHKRNAFTFPVHLALSS